MKKALHIEVYKDLFNKITSGYFAIGDKLPTESEMQRIYGVSRAPIRQALGKLEEKGLIDRKPGIGTVVIKCEASVPWPSVGGFSSNFSKKWRQLKVKTIDVSKVISDIDVTNSLELEPESPTIKVTRIRTENDIPIFLLINYYIDADVEKIKNAGDILNMRQFASEVLGVNFSYVTEELTAVPADEQTSYLLQVEKGFPVLQIKRVSFDSNYHPVEYVKYFVNTIDWPYNITYNQDSGDFDL
ncbi:GntR family transcriptional regulator [Bacillus sp. NTK034]|uniref:GntR family transcriptional regulator n=1 Tax=Bacillus sp. NTK034 TaxID=2802176 RepID=UPI001A8D6BEC|nr:GntR family transcriptional regulator [Bacillus sp. NTK034]MBN8201430.1 GntR family transcriptional regulator [Bacillus sp. NTK034]